MSAPLRTEPTPPRAQWPARIKFVEIRPLGLSLKVDVYALVLTCILVAATTVVAIWSLGISTTSSASYSIVDVLRVLTGQLSGPAANHVEAWLPAVITAVLGGASLALSGAIFQTVTRNPLGSPDIIGFTTGANTGALIAMLVLGLGKTGGTIGALIGCLATGLVVYFLGMRGGMGSTQFVIVGVGVSAMLLSFNGYLIATANRENAAAAASWGIGSLRDLQLSDTIPVLVTLLILVPILIAVAPRMRMFELGADSAASKGVNVDRTQIVLLIVGVGFAAATTAIAGPIAFVALVAPQIASRISRSPGIPLVISAAVGAALLVVSDVIARTILAPDTQLPVGVITTSLGGIYLLLLLIAQSRKATP